MISLKEQWRALLQRIGLSTEEVQPVKAQHLRQLQKALADENEAAEIAPETQTAEPTQTLAREDPPPTEPIRSANETAYETDLRNFK